MILDYATLEALSSHHLYALRERSGNENFPKSALEYLNEPCAR